MPLMGRDLLVAYLPMGASRVALLHGSDEELPCACSGDTPDRHPVAPRDGELGAWQLAGLLPRAR